MFFCYKSFPFSLSPSVFFPNKRVWRTPKWMVKIMENPMKMDDMGGKPTILGNIQAKSVRWHLFSGLLIHRGFRLCCLESWPQDLDVFFCTQPVGGLFRHRYFCFESNGILVGGWTNPFWKICSSNWKSSPNRGEHEKIFETTTIHVCLVVQCFFTLKGWLGNCQLEAWLVVSTHPKNISKNGNLPQVGVKINNDWNHHLVSTSCTFAYWQSSRHQQMFLFFVEPSLARSVQPCHPVFGNPKHVSPASYHWWFSRFGVNKNQCYK